MFCTKTHTSMMIILYKNPAAVHKDVNLPARRPTFGDMD
jgi:hypothetical protein